MRSIQVAFECHAPIEVAVSRAQRRFKDGRSNSDAGALVARRLAAERDPWPESCSIDTNVPVQQVISTAVLALAEVTPNDRVVPVR